MYTRLPIRDACVIYTHINRSERETVVKYHDVTSRISVGLSADAFYRYRRGVKGKIMYQYGWGGADTTRFVIGLVFDRGGVRVRVPITKQYAEIGNALRTRYDNGRVYDHAFSTTGVTYGCRHARM